MSPRTLYRYFASKEDVIVEGAEDYLFFDLLGTQSMRGSALDLVRDALHLASGTMRPDEKALLLARVRLAVNTPALFSRLLNHMVQREEEFAVRLAQRVGRPSDDLAVHTIAAAVTAAVRVAMTRWIQQDFGANPLTLVDEALDVLAGGLRLESEKPPA